MKRLERVVRATVGILTSVALLATASTLSSATTPSLTTVITTPNAAAASADLSNDMVYAPSSGSSVSSTRSTSTTSTTHVNHVVWVSVESATASTSDDVNTGITTATAQALVARMNSYWSQESNGLVTISFGGFETRSLNQSSCVASTVFSTAPTVAFNGKFKNNAWQGTFTHLLVLTTEGCNNAGLGSVGGDGGIMLSGSGTDTALATPVAAHEFGHNLGYGHAGSSICDSPAQDAASTASYGSETSMCPTNEYGDYLDIMGYSVSGALPHLSTPQRIRSGYLTDYTSITSSSGPVTSTVTPLDGAANNRALRITDPLSGAIYYVEYRTASGTDATSSEFTDTLTCFGNNGYNNCSRGASTSVGSLRILRELPYRDYTQYVRTTVLAATSMGGSQTYRLTRFAAGTTFTSANGGFYLAVNSLNPAAGASVTVRFTPPTATTTALNLTTATQTHGATPATAVATISTADGSPASGVATFSDGKTAIAVVPVSENGTVALPLSATLKAGKHSISVRFTPSTGDETASGSSARSLVVKKASSKTVITKTKRTGVKLRVTVAVTVAGVTRPTGTVTIYANGKRLASAKLGAASTVTITAKLAKKLVKSKITAKYSGTANISPKTSAAQKLR